MLVAIAMHISYTARLQGNCNPAVLRTGIMRELPLGEGCSFIANDLYQLTTDDGQLTTDD